MTINTSFVKMNRNLNLENYAKKKIEKKIEKLNSEPVWTNITFTKDRRRSIVRLHIKGKKNEPVIIEEKDENMYASVNNLTKRLKNIVEKHKSKSHRSKANPLKGMPLREEEISEEVEEELALLEES